MNFEIIPFEDCDPLLDWHALGNALRTGHGFPKAEIGDTFLYRDPDTLLSRSAWIDGMGLAVKSVTIYPRNPDRGNPMINGSVNLFSDADGSLEALLDFHLVTKWKTAGDSFLAAKLLARPDSKVILIVGAGTVGRSLYAAYSALFPDAQFLIWNRSNEGARRFAEELPGVSVVADLEDAVRAACIVTSATMTTEPLIRGDWLQPGQHIDLIGAYRPDMREVNDIALQRARIFVDSRNTTLDHIGELKIPLAAGSIAPADIVADYYDMSKGLFCRRDDSEITLFKNGGGAHLDLMTSRYILAAWRAR